MPASSAETATVCTPADAGAWRQPVGPWLRAGRGGVCSGGALRLGSSHLVGPIALRPDCGADRPADCGRDGAARHLPSATRLSWSVTASPHLGLHPFVTPVAGDIERNKAAAAEPGRTRHVTEQKPCRGCASRHGAGCARLRPAAARCHAARPRGQDRRHRPRQRSGKTAPLYSPLHQKEPYPASRSSATSNTGRTSATSSTFSHPRLPAAHGRSSCSCTAAASSAATSAPRQPVLRQHHAVGGAQWHGRRQRDVPAGAAIRLAGGRRGPGIAVRWVARQHGGPWRRSEAVSS